MPDLLKSLALCRVKQESTGLLIFVICESPVARVIVNNDKAMVTALTEKNLALKDKKLDFKLPGT